MLYYLLNDLCHSSGSKTIYQLEPIYSPGLLRFFSYPESHQRNVTFRWYLWRPAVSSPRLSLVLITLVVLTNTGQEFCRMSLGFLWFFFAFSVFLETYDCLLFQTFPSKMYDWKIRHNMCLWAAVFIRANWESWLSSYSNLGDWWEVGGKEGGRKPPQSLDSNLSV